MEFKADLHCHSNCSDGTDSPFELLEIAKKNSLQGLSITDHDTLDAYTPELFAYAKKLGVRLLVGIELSTQIESVSVHLLGYGIDLESALFRNFLSEMIMRRNRRNIQILEKLKKKGMQISVEELDSKTFRTTGRPHIAEIMVRKGYVANIQEAFERYLKDGGSCYVAGIKFTPLEAIEKIHQAGGKAVVAHPHLICQKSIVKKLLKYPLDGLECYYGNLHPNVEAYWLQIAQEKGLIATGGSDYHGAIKPHIKLGRSWVGHEVFESFFPKKEASESGLD